MKNYTQSLQICCWLALASATPAALAGGFFSLDIGSDTEISDPAGGAGEFADPGDIYRTSPVVGSLLGVAPTLDDATMFPGGDPAPVQNVVASAAPIGVAGQYGSFFDLDGYDAIGTPLSQLGLNGDGPLATPILRDNVAIDCVYRPDRLTISFSDDSTSPWGAPMAPRVPTEGPSPLGSVYGTTAGGDEVTSLDIDTTAGFPAPVLGVAPRADEIGVHVDLGPNPGLGGAADDDVDALDEYEETGCYVHYFSADSEGRLNLNPGFIYEFSGAAAPSAVITPAHLGLPMNMNIDAFEFAWLPTPNGQGTALALLFSVQADNPGSAIDESGGLVPSSIYASFMTGTSFVLVDGPANGLDDVDAISVRPPETEDSDGDGIADAADNCILVANPAQVDADSDGIGNQCDQDLTQDCDVNIADVAAFRLVFFSTDMVADFNVDEIVNLGDLLLLKQGIFLPPGPAAEPNLCMP